MLQEIIDNLLAQLLHGTGWLNSVSRLVTIALIFVSAILAYYVTKFLINRIVPRLTKSRSSVFLRVISKNKTIHLIAHIVAGIVLLLGSDFVKEHDDIYSTYESIILNKLSLLYIFLIILFIISRIIWSVNSYYEKSFDYARQHPIYSYLKVVVLLVWIIGLVLIISFFMDTSPSALLTGIGAVSAVLLLVFRDTLLGIISSIQATALNIVKIGDRISIDKYNLDGTVLDVAISSVKIKNGDNTVANVPTHMLTTEIIKNWHGIEESGVRRIKRSVCIDINSITPCSEELLNSLKTYACIEQYLETKHKLVISNLELFRVFFQNYLDNSSSINHESNSYLRHLDPTPYGLPLEVCAFTNTVILKEFEQIQAEIFEYLFCKLPEFRLKVYNMT